jgi:hypothetical protein
MKKIGFDAAIIAIGLFSAFSATPAMAQFSPGDILVSDYNANHVQQFSSSGTLIRTFAGTGTECLGTLVAPSGNLFVVCRNGSSLNKGTVNIFSPSGVQTGSFAIPQVYNAGDMTLFPDGTLAVTDFSGPVQEYTQSGTFIRTVPVDGPYDRGDAVASNDGSLWITGETEKMMYDFSETGTLLGSFSVPFEPSNLQVARDGSLWIGGLFDSHVYHYTASGVQIGLVSTSLPSTEAVALSLDQSTIDVTYEGASSIFEYSTAGTALGSFAVPGANDLSYLNTVVPEPSMLGVLSVCLLPLCRRRRRYV